MAGFGRHLFEPLDQMQSGLRFDNARHFANFEGECSIFEWLLHCATREWTQITATLSRTTVRILLRQVSQCDLTGFYLSNEI